MTGPKAKNSNEKKKQKKRLGARDHRQLGQLVKVVWLLKKFKITSSLKKKPLKRKRIG